MDAHERWRVEHISSRWAEGESDWFFLADPTNQAGAEYGVARQLNVHREWVNRPSVFLIDKEGVLRWARIGKAYNDRPSAEEVLEQIDQWHL